MVLKNAKHKRLNFQPLQLQEFLYIEEENYCIPVKKLEDDENRGVVVIKYFDD